MHKDRFNEVESYGMDRRGGGPEHHHPMGHEGRPGWEEHHEGHCGERGGERHEGRLEMGRGGFERPGYERHGERHPGHREGFAGHPEWGGHEGRPDFGGPRHEGFGGGPRHQGFAAHPGRGGGRPGDEGGPHEGRHGHGRPGRRGFEGRPDGRPEGRGEFGGRPQRIFDHGDVRYVIVALLAEKPSYGYELIKAIEERLNGAYAPSPGLVYPTLTMLEEMGYATAETGESGKKLYSLTPEGKSFLEINKPLVDAIFGRMERAAARHRRTESPEMVRAIQNLRLAIHLKSSRSELTDTQVRAIADALDEATKKIEQC